MSHYREHNAIEIPVFLRHWEDVSYHNDLCARSEYQLGRHTITIWVERADPADREYPDSPQFIVEFCPDGDLNSEDLESLYKGDDRSQAAQWARAAEIVARGASADDDMDSTDKAQRIRDLVAKMETN
jgi:elongation factor P hydroxylase